VKAPRGTQTPVREKLNLTILTMQGKICYTLVKNGGVRHAKYLWY
jgi:hypothetical protein